MKLISATSTAPAGQALIADTLAAFSAGASSEVHKADYRINYLAKCSADNHGNSEVDDIAFADKCLEV
jgi:hypothetical protein